MIRKSLTSLSSLQYLADLAERCAAVDGYPVKLYWNFIETRRYDANAFDYLYVISPEHPIKPVALLSAYSFQDGVEITAMVDPDFRGQGICRQLMERVQNDLRRYDVKSYLLICHAKAIALNERCAALGATLEHSEIEMQGPPLPICIPKKPLILEPANQKDMKLLVDIHKVCFPESSLESIQTRLAAMLKDKNRLVWIAKNETGQPVGKLHAREDANAVFLHDLGIMPPFQQQGYGVSLLYHWYQCYTFPPNKKVLIDVLGDNHAALALYDKCGFILTNQYNFWRFPLIR